MKKLSLKQLKVQSFVTSLETGEINTVKGRGHAGGEHADKEDWVTQGEKCEPTGELQCDTVAEFCEFFRSQKVWCEH